MRKPDSMKKDLTKSVAERKLNAVECYTGDIDRAGVAFIRAAQTRKRKIRNALIYHDFIKADDKNQKIKDLAEHWGLSPKLIENIIVKQKRDGISYMALAAKTEALRQIKASQILQSTEDVVSEINIQINNLYAIKSSGEDMVTVEEVEVVGDKSITKTKKLPINGLLVKLYTRRQEILADEAKTLEAYTGKVMPDKAALPAGTARITIEADNDFAKEFMKMRGFVEGTKEAEFTEVKADENA